MVITTNLRPTAPGATFSGANATLLSLSFGRFFPLAMNSTG
jgi:hypothetical protein